MSGVVAFDAAAFVVAFPAFAAYNAAHVGGLQFYFDSAATLHINNTPASRVSSLPARRILLWLVTAHLAQLAGVADAGTPSTGAKSAGNRVGRVSSGSEGGVKADFDAGTATASSAYWMQTQYGAQYWAATARYRSFRYSAPARCC